MYSNSRVTKKETWKLLGGGVAEILAAIGTICLATVFLGFMKDDQTSTVKAVSVFLFLGILVLNFLCFGVYHLFLFLDKKFGYYSSTDKIIRSVLVGALLLVFGLVGIYSAVMDIMHFFSCVEYVNSPYWKSALLSIAPFAGLSASVFSLVMFIYLIKEGGVG
jgi:hypothetical protein